MKSIKTIMMTMLAGLALVACTDKPANQRTSYTVNVNVEGLADSTVVTLVPITHDKEDALGEAVAMGGKVQFTGEATDTMVVGLIVKGSYGSARFVLDNSDIDITGNVTKGKAWDGTDEYKWDITVAGSPLTDKFLTLYAERDKLDELYREYHEQYKDVLAKHDAIKDPNELRAFEETDEFKPFMEAENNFFETVDKTLNGIVLDNKDTFWGPLMATMFMSYFDSENAEIYNQFSEAAKQSFYGRKMKEEIWPVAMTGEPVKPFTVQDDNGNDVTLAQLLEGKKYVLLDFWASWCGPCRKELPNVKAQYALYKDKGFGVVGISIDKDEEAWRKAVADEQLEWPNFRSPEVADLYKVSAVPTVYLIDAEGKIVAQNMDARGEALVAKLAELFK